jgi:hypothetical protein
VPRWAYICHAAGVVLQSFPRGVKALWNAFGEYFWFLCSSVFIYMVRLDF